MIVLDLEMSGIKPEKNGIWQIAALDLQNPGNYFFDECRIDDDEECDPKALYIIGKTEAELRNPEKQSQKQLLQNFFKWTSKIKNRTIIAQNPGFDLMFIFMKSRKHKLELNIPYRSLDMHSIASIKYFQINNKFLIKEDGDKSAMDLTNVLKFCGMPDLRRAVDQKTNKIIQEGTPHNALEDTKLTAECFSRIVYGKNLFTEYSKSPIPAYLKPNN